MPKLIPDFDAMDIRALDDWCADVIGYRPAADFVMSLAEMRAYCKFITGADEP